MECIDIDTSSFKNFSDYYRNSKLWLPPKSSWRFFLFKSGDKVKRFDSIRNVEDLRELILKFKPDKVYFSCSMWLNVEHIRGIKKTDEHPIKVGQDVIFDIDNDESLQEARKSCLRVVDRAGKEPDYILITGRGFHIAYYDEEENKKELMDKVRDIRDVDLKATKNQHNVFALPLTLKNGKICNFISYEELRNKTAEELDEERTIYNLYDNRDRAERNCPRNSNEEATSQCCPNGQSSRIIESGMESAHTIHSFNNVVKGGKNKIYIPILIYSKNINSKRLYEELKRLANQYDLGDLYIFENENFLVAVSLKCMQYRRLEKILNSTRNKVRKTTMVSEFKKFKKIWFNFEDYSPKGKLSFNTNKFFRASRKHYNALKKMGFDMGQEIDEFVGHPKLKILKVYLNGN